MNLSGVHIKNFRSIADLHLDFDIACQCLIGINESGKSNILRALHLLDRTASPSAADLRIERHDEAQVTTGHVRFQFELTTEELDEVIEAASAHFEPLSLDLPVATDGKRDLNLADYCRLQGAYPVAQGLYQILLPAGTRNTTVWSRTGDRFLSGWFRNKTTAVVNLPAEGGTLSVPARGYVRAPDGVELSGDAFEKADHKELSNLVSPTIKKIVDRELPTCIFWRYADKYLLPSTVDVGEFCASPDSCVPLKSMFELAGYSANNLATTISNAQSQGHYRYLQILEKTAAKATEHIRAVWSDYKTVRIKLESHGGSISPIVTDDVVPMDMANRSDGFKRFVSFLLQISAKVRTSELSNALILIDEPEIALHPSGAKSLLSELIAIGETNVVVFSTHSIFMIDKGEIGRHLVVEKKKEVTTTWRAEKSRIQDEEVLYSAIGYSIFEALKQYNVIFEGWRDKRIFDVVATSMAKADAELRQTLGHVGLTFADGVKDVRNVAHFLQLASRPCLIISDADKAALQHRNSYQCPGAWGRWKTLQDVLPGMSVITGEDLIARAAVVKKANRFRTRIKGLGPLAEDFFSPPEATIVGLRRWLETAGLKDSNIEEILSELKNVLFEDLKRSDLNDHAEQLVKFVAEYDWAAAP